jgi:hypothetical protein
MGSVVISLDAELAWGYHDKYPHTPAQRRRVQGARRAWEELLVMFDEFDVPATWAVVGHLLTDGEGFDDRHPAGPEWFRAYRERRDEAPDRWLGEDLVRATANADANHEIGSHSYSHVVFSGATEEVADAELRFSQELSESGGFECSSFVFPRNRVDHRASLGDHGYTCYRGQQPFQGPDVTGGHFATMLAGYLTGVTAPPLVTPERDEHGLVNVPASLFVGGFLDGPWSVVEPLRGDPVVRLTKLGLDRLVDRDGVFHLWFHPNDATDSRVMDRMRTILSLVAAYRDRGQIRVETMADVAQRVQRTQPVSRTR